MPSPDFDCTTCGACCFGAHDRYIALLPEDRGRAIPATLTTETEGRRYMKMCGGHCATLSRTADARLVCGIYDARPEACRAFRAGSFECLKARQYRGAAADALRFDVVTTPSDTHPVEVTLELAGAGAGAQNPRLEAEPIPSP